MRNGDFSLSPQYGIIADTLFISHIIYGVFMNRQRIYLTIFIFSLLFVSTAFSMPPYPGTWSNMDLAQKRSIVELQDDLRARGVNNPSAWLAEASTEIDVDTFRVILLLVDFSDKVASVDSAFFDTLMFGQGTGSVRDFYQEVSYNTLEIATIDSPSTTGWLRMPQPYSYYVDNQYGFGNYPRNAQGLVRDAVNAADDSVDFSQYDNDGDGYVDGLMVVHAGTGAEASKSVADIWSHAWSIYPITHDGVTVYKYAIQPEYWPYNGNQVDMTVGVFCHEMGHSIFGLPDLYDYDEDPDASAGLDKWSLMAGGSWNGFYGASPAHPDAWCLTQMGFVDPVNITLDTDSLVIPSVQAGPNIFRVWTDGAASSEYFLLENRRKTGFDSTLPGSGLLIYHVDESVTTDNDKQWYPGLPDDEHYLVALEQADGRYELEHDGDADSADPWPGNSNNRAFTEFSSPNTYSYEDGKTWVAVDNISDNADTMSVRIHVSSLPVFSAVTSVLDTLQGIITLSWEPYDTTTQGSDFLYEISLPGDSIFTTTDTSFVDTLPEVGTYRYTVQAVYDRFASNSSSVEIVYLSSVGVQEYSSTLPVEFQLGSAFPNPFNPETRLTLKLPETTHVTVTVYDILGREVAVLLDSETRAGTSNLTVHAGDWASGIYFVRAQTASGLHATRKIVLTR